MIRSGFVSLDPEEFIGSLDPPRPSIAAELLMGSSMRGATAHRAVGVTEGTARPHLGWIAPLADMITGAPVAVAIGAGWTCVTLGLTLEWTGRPLRPGVDFTGFGMPNDPSRRFELASGVIAQGETPVALVNARFVAAPEPPPWPEAGRPPSAQARGLSLAQALDLRQVGAERFDFDGGVDMANPNGVIHGGIQMAAAAEVMTTIAPADAGWTLEKISADFLSPAASAGGRRAELRVERGPVSRRFMRLRVSALRSDGRVASTVDGILSRPTNAS